MNKIPSMTSEPVLDYLTQIGSEWTGKGVAVECGCWLGASMSALAKGLVEAGYRFPLVAFDQWIADEEQVEKAHAQGVKLELGQDTLPIFMQNVYKVYDWIDPNQELIHEGPYFLADTEIFLLDACKGEPAFSQTIERFAPSWIPGVTIVGLMDYTYYRNFEGEKHAHFRCQERWVEEQGDRLSPLRDFRPLVPTLYLCEAFFKVLAPITL